MPLSTPKQALIAKLMTLITQRVLDRCLIKTGDFKGLYHHSNVGSHEKSLLLLKKAGVFRVAERAILTLNVRKNSIPQKIQEFSKIAQQDQLDLAIKAFVDLFTEFPEERFPELPTTRHAFTPPQIYLPLIVLFAESGYAAKSQNGWIWTDKMIPAMAEICVWSYDGKPFDD